MPDVIHHTYLPFSEEQLRGHFAPLAGKTRTEEADRHLRHYRESVRRLAEYEAASPVDQPSLTQRGRQLEKDERFWIVAAAMAAYHGPNRGQAFAALMTTTLGDQPPIEGLDSWQEALAEPLHLFFEANLPSPSSYRRWLRRHLNEQHLVPYVLEAAERTHRLEGATHVDSLLLSETTGFSVLFEAKVLSDVSVNVTFDARRNQIARNVDVMLETNERMPAPLSKRDPDRSCFVLVTPETFRQHPQSRLYGWLMQDYREGAALRRDLPHREADWLAVSRRLGWLTWEDWRRSVPESCLWLA